MPSICLVYGFVVALKWLWVALPGLPAICLLPLAFSPTLGSSAMQLRVMLLCTKPLKAKVFYGISVVKRAFSKAQPLGYALNALFDHTLFAH